MSHLVYSRHYNIGLFGLERLHPFDSRKYGRAYRRLRKRLGSREVKRVSVSPAGPVSRKELLLVHQPQHLDRLSDSRYVAAALELPAVGRMPGWAVDRLVLRPMRWATAGTVLAARLALQHRFAVNLGGGFHHAKPNSGEGFCVYADIPLAVATLRREGLLAEHERVAYIDLDAHQGNGVCHCFFDDPRVFVLDMYNQHIYPYTDLQAKDRIDCDLPLDSGTDGDRYLLRLRRHLPGFLDSIHRDPPVALAIYNAGTDVFQEDPLGLLNVSAAQVLERDLYVMRQLAEREIPAVMLLSGGYTKQSYRLVAATVERLL